MITIEINRDTTELDIIPHWYSGDDFSNLQSVMKRYCLALDLIDDADLIREYEQYHEQVWPEIRKSIFDAGIFEMNIYRFANRLSMIIDADDDFSFESKAAMDSANPKVQEWEQLMWKYQQSIPGSKELEKWVLMKNIYSLSK